VNIGRSDVLFGIVARTQNLQREIDPFSRRVHGSNNALSQTGKQLGFLLEI